MFLSLVRVIWSRPKTAVLVLALSLLIGAGAGLYGYALHRWHRARAAVEEGRPAEARDSLAFCLTVWPGSPEVHLLAARAARLNGDILGAEAHLKRCMQLQRGAAEDTQLEYLLLRVQTGEEEEVARDLFRLVDGKHPQTPLILETVARAYMQRLRYGPAYSCLERWMKEVPGAAKPYHWRSWVQERMDNPKEAMKDYLKALELDPDLAAVRLRVAEMLLEDNQPGPALVHLERLRKLQPDSPEVLARLGQCRLLQGEQKEARKLLEAAVQKLPNDVPVLLHLGKLEMDDNPVRAEEWLRRAQKVDPMDTEVQFNLANALQLQGRREEAAATLERCEKLKAVLKRANLLLKEEARASSKDPLPPTEVGSLLVEIGSERQGVYWLEQALQRDPNYQPAHRALAEYYEKKGDTQRAAAHRSRLTEPAKKVSAP
jgi:tetratricopeptide (TPR) repeat protein